MALLVVAGSATATLWLSAQNPLQPPPPHQSGSHSSVAAGKSKTKPAAHHEKAVRASEVPQVPPPPPTLEQQSPTPPLVTYRDGLLTISATNSTLSQVLQSVQSKTGAAVDIPPGGGSERVASTIGPGRPQSVLATLLNGSKFNYVILGEPNNPGAVQKIILLAKTNAPANGQFPMAQNNARPQPQQQGIEPPDDEYPQNEPEIDNQVQPQPAVQTIPGAENGEQEGTNPGNRTPEQMLQDLQRLQEQQQQLQQQLNPANQQPFGQPFNPNTPQQQPLPFPNQPQSIEPR